MKGYLIIPVEYRGEKLEFKGKLLKGRYGYKIKVKVDGGEIVFDPDEEGRYVARVRAGSMEGEGEVDGELVEVIKGIMEEVRESK